MRLRWIFIDSVKSIPMIGAIFICLSIARTLWTFIPKIKQLLFWSIFEPISDLIFKSNPQTS